MKSFTSVLVAGFAALAQAVSLTNTEFNVKPGQPFEITWADAQGPVTLTLKNGANTNLKTVQTITSGATGTSFSWTPSSSLPSDTYAIEISDGTDVNYSVQFPVAGTGSASPSASATASASASATTGASSSASATVTATVTSASASSASASESASESSSISASISSAANSTIASSTLASSTRGSSTRTSATSGSTTAPTTVPGGDAGRIGSPIALIGLTIAAMLYFQ